MLEKTKAYRFIIVMPINVGDIHEKEHMQITCENSHLILKKLKLYFTKLRCFLRIFVELQVYNIQHPITLSY